jgi:hypothetical protein
MATAVRHGLVTPKCASAAAVVVALPLTNAELTTCHKYYQATLSAIEPLHIEQDCLLHRLYH